MSDLEKRVLEWLREQRDLNGSGRCYGLEEIARAVGCGSTDLLDDARDSGVLRSLSDEGHVAITFDRTCAFAQGGRIEWD